jgi:hypothetical protein
MESKSAGSKHVPAERKTGGEKMKLDAKDQSFWVLMEGVLADALTPAEASAVITKMKKVSSLQNGGDICYSDSAVVSNISFSSCRV